MNVLLDDLLDGIVHKVQDSLVPAIEVVTQTATHEYKNRLQTPPSSVDLLYVTDRLIVSSQPVVSSNPSYTDNGRDGGSIRDHVSKPVSGPATGNSTRGDDSCSSQVYSTLQHSSSETKRLKKRISFQAPKTSTSEKYEAIAHISECGARLTEEERTKDPDLDISDTPQSNMDIGKAKIADLENVYRNANEENLSASTATNKPAICDFNFERAASVPVVAKNPPDIMTSFLDKRHGSENYLAFSLMDESPDDRTLLLFRRQIVQLCWWSPCMERSETPSVPNLLKTCYAIHAYLQLDPQNVALVYCSNGKTRTAIAVACYLKFAGIVKHCEEGFLHFLSKRGIRNPEATWRQLPPSLRLFFKQFDIALSIGGYLNRKPLRLRGIALQGVPVEDKPCLDIWDSSQRHVYSSHPEMWDASMVRCNSASASSQWVDEEGLYKVNVCLDGDFLVLCRFGGDFAKDTKMHDPSKILFRYTNNTGFLGGGYPYELPSTKVDLTRRYALHLDHEDFLVTLIFQADWEEIEIGEEKERAFGRLSHKRKNSEEGISLQQVWRSHDRQAVDEGLKVIFQRHSARPDEYDIKTFRSLHGEELFEKCADRLVCLALQLTNFNHIQTNELLLSSPSFAWWRFHAHGDTCKEMSVLSSGLENKKEHGTCPAEKDCAIDRKRVQNMLGMLDTTDVFKNLYPNDVESFKELNETLERHLAVLDAQRIPERRRSALYRSKRSRKEGHSDDVGWMVPGIAHPHGGDIVRSFGADCSTMGRKSSKPRLSLSLPRVPHHQDINPCVHGGQLNHYDRRHNISSQVLCQMQHTGFALPDLLELLTESQQWDGVASRARLKGIEEKTGLIEAGRESKESSMNRKSKEQKEKEWKEARSAEEKERRRKISGGDQRSPDTGKQPVEQEGVTTDSSKPLKDDPEYAKYFKMLKMGMPLEQVEHAMKRDEKDPKVLQLDPEKSLDEQIPEQPETDDEDMSLKEDPEYQKYFRMLKMGLPKDAVKNALLRDGKDPSVVDLDPTKSLSSQYVQRSSYDDPPLQHDPDYQKYFKMLKMGMPPGAVKNALVRDGKDPSIVDLDPGKSLKSQMLAKEDAGIPLKEDPEYRKYFKMVAMGLPVDAVKNALIRDGKDPSVLDLDPSKSVRFQLGENTKKDAGVPLKDDPEYSKYFKMLGMGLPHGAVKNALERDGKDPHVLDLDPEKSVVYQLKESAASKKSAAKKKKKVRRKKIYWNPIDPGKLKKDSMWHIVRDVVNMTKLNYDQKEFEELFTESSDPKDAKKKQKSEKSVKKLVQVIDPKRSMNGGIILARLKIDYSKIADIVNKMERSKFDSTQLSALKEFLPDADERRGLIGYMQSSKTSKEVLYTDLSETEKYMATMIDVAEASEKMDAMLFRCVFKNRFEDVNAGIETLNSACDQLRSSEKLRKLMAMILTVVNEINTGGEGNLAVGFTLDALLKLNEAKAFDKKTSVLHYVVKLVKKNDNALLTFSNDISSVIPAESVLLDSLASEVKALGHELNGVHKTVKTEAERLEEAGELRPMTLEDLKEQRTSVRQVGSVSQFNKMNHHTGRTPMERFMVNAKCSCDQAIISIDDVRKKYLALLEYFGENENMPTGDFFGILRRFMREFQKAVEQVEAIEKKEAKERKRAAAKAAKAAAKKPDRPNRRSKKGRCADKSVLPNMRKGQLANALRTDSRDAIAAGTEATVESTRDSHRQTRSDLLSAMAAAGSSRKGLQGKDPLTTMNEIAIISNSNIEKTDNKSVEISSNVKAGDGDHSVPENHSEFDSTAENNATDFYKTCSPSAKSEKEKPEEEGLKKSINKSQGSDPSARLLHDENETSACRGAKQQGAVKVPDRTHSSTNGDQVAQPSRVANSVLPKVEASHPHKMIGTGLALKTKAKIVASTERLSQVGHQNNEGDHKESSPLSSIAGMNTATESKSDRYDSAVCRIEEQLSDLRQGTQQPFECSLKELNDEPTEQVLLDLKSLQLGEGEKADIQALLQNEKARQSPIALLEARETEEKPATHTANFEHSSTTIERNTSVLDSKLNSDDPSSAALHEAGERNILQFDATKDETQIKDRSDPTSAIENVRVSVKGTKAPSLSCDDDSTPAKSQDNLEGHDLTHKVAHSSRERENDEVEAPKMGFDDLSVAESIPKQPMEVRMSKTWTDGEEITNWMPWADKVINACDSDSVVGFEVPRDLNDGLEFDDDSTVASSTSFASNFDDLSFASGFNTPGKLAPLQRPTTSPFDPYFDDTEQPPDSFFGSVGGRLEAPPSSDDA